MIDKKNLVFEGGGVKGIAYAGAIEGLEAGGLLDKIVAVAGTSAGAITATLLALRYSASEIKNLVNSTNFKSFEDGWNPLEVPLKYGLYKGQAFLNWMENAVKQKIGKSDATFADLNTKGCRDLKIFACDLNEKAVKEFSFEATPTVVVSQAARASMSIPLFFRAWQFPDKNPDAHLFVDGGTIYNYPINAFDANGYNNETLGFFLENTSGNPIASNLKYDELLKYVRNLFDTVLLAQKIDFNKNVADVARTVIIDDFGISATDFGITDAQKTQLYNSGLGAVNKYIKSNT
ncbi:patatin-like phospholipase family protein [Portibacter marinus]|uniref:patatin-like phospholipase family protein n=1 Tax=Portibacter marinus TaxID=2898660 RepID=UPI001F40AE48|nr:patatin-like phospholipase family protein [Portibacter marinus]